MIHLANLLKHNYFFTNDNQKVQTCINNDVGLGTNGECQHHTERNNGGRVMWHIFPNISGKNPT